MVAEPENVRSLAGGPHIANFSRTCPTQFGFKPPFLHSDGVFVHRRVIHLGEAEKIFVHL